MSKIVIGESDGKQVRIDLDILLRTRMLIQANSGKGKSWLLRRLAEQLFGKVQVIIIDPEGEFATLREKFDFVLVGKGGETAAHPRIAGLTAQRLLELRACAVIDIYELKPSERHSYVKNFLDALIDAPKNLWHPLIVIVDEAHVYCPEKGAGESEASEAVIGMATRGRKRGYCLIAATQRLGKFRKDAAAEMLNICVGGTFIDIDRKRAADALGVYGQDLHPFFDEIRLLEKGNFYCLGPAVSDQKLLVQVGQVETTHPEAGSAKHAAEPPPTPAKIRAMLPSLADLPKEAEEKAKSIADLQKQVRELKGELSKRPTEVQQVVEEKIVEVPVLKDEQIAALVEAVGAFISAANGIQEAIGKVRNFKPVNINRPRPSLPAPRPQPIRVERNPAANGDLSGPEQNILNQLAELDALGIPQPEKSQLSLMAGYTNFRSGGFSEPLARLLSAGYLTYPIQGKVALTEEGRVHAAPSDQPLSSAELHDRLCRKLGNTDGRILREIISLYPDPISKDELGQRLGYTNPRSGGFSEPVGRLRSLGIIEYPQQGQVKASDWLFIA